MNKEKILIADDEEDILELLKFNLAKEGYQVLCAASGEEALDIIFSELPELILLDIMMPNMNGYEVCRCLKNDLRNQNTPVIFLTAVQDIKNKILGFETGAVDYITKPFVVSEVMVRVKTHLSIKKNYEEILRKTKEGSEMVVRAKSEFLAKASHEIRNPISGIMGMTNLLLRTGITSQQKDYLSLLSSASGSLLSLLNNILDFSKIEAGKIEMDICDFDIRKTIEEMEDLLAIKANESGIEFASLVYPDVPSLLRGDSNRLKQILLNLVGNAVKFTKKGEVIVRVSILKETITHIKIRFIITDTGAGIPKNCLDRLFKPFSQADRSTARNYGGIGLGLTISKQLTEMMGGEIGVESEEGKGQHFGLQHYLKNKKKKNKS